MPNRLRKFIGAILLLVLVMVWALLAMALAQSVLLNINGLVGRPVLLRRRVRLGAARHADHLLDGQGRPGEGQRRPGEGSSMTDTVRDNPDQNRFELATPAGTAFASYRRDDYTVAIMHTEVPRALEGRGLGSNWSPARSITSAPKAARSCRCAPSCATSSTRIRTMPIW